MPSNNVKRSTDSIKTIYKLLLGIIIGSLYSFICVLMVYKTGMAISAALVTPFIFYLLLKLFYTPKTQEITLVQSISSGASMGVFCLDSGFAAVVIMGSGVLRVSLFELILLGIGMNFFGIIFASFLINSWILKEKLPFPKARVVGEVINSLNNSSNKNETTQLIISIISASVICTATSIFKKLRNPLASISNLPSFIGIELSPLLFGLGMFLPIKTVALIIVGAGYSVLIWVTKLNLTVDLSYRDFLFHPYVFSVAMGLAFGFTIYNIIRLFKYSLTTLVKKNQLFDRKSAHKLDYRLIILLLIAIFLCVFGQFSFLNIPFYYMLILLLLCCFFALMSTRVRVESGMGVSTPIFIAIPIVYLMNKDFTTILLLSAGIILATVASYSSLEANYVGYMTKTSLKKVTRMYVLGVLCGTIAGSISIFILHQKMNIGSDSLPAPSAIAWGTFARVLISGGNVDSINIILLIIAGVIGFLLSIFHLSSILIAIGILLPVSASMPIFLGWMTLKILNHKKINIVPAKIGAGLITGEGIISMIKATIMFFP